MYAWLQELVDGLELLGRDQLRRAYTRCAGLLVHRLGTPAIQCCTWHVACSVRSLEGVLHYARPTLQCLICCAAAGSCSCPRWHEQRPEPQASAHPVDCCRLPTLAPRLPFLPALPAPPEPPVFVPGRGFMGMRDFVETAAPPLTRAEEIYLQSLTELAKSLTGKLLWPTANPGPCYVAA